MVAVVGVVDADDVDVIVDVVDSAGVDGFGGKDFRFRDWIRYL